MCVAVEALLMNEAEGVGKIRSQTLTGHEEDSGFPCTVSTIRIEGDSHG